MRSGNRWLGFCTPSFIQGLHSPFTYPFLVQKLGPFSSEAAAKRETRKAAEKKMRDIREFLSKNPKAVRSLRRKKRSTAAVPSFTFPWEG